MRKLTDLEIEMLKTIQKYYPISWSDVRSVWEIVKSYDRTIDVIEYANSHGECYIVSANKIC